MYNSLVKKRIFLSAVLIFFSSLTFAANFPQFEFGLGSGYAFYGGSEERSLISEVDRAGQAIIGANVAVIFPLSQYLKFSLGADALLDARWKDDLYAHLFDYCGSFGVRIYPGLGGLLFSVNYCVGRRTNFYNTTEKGEGISHSDVGIGFSLGAAYEFGSENSKLSPVISAAWRNMPRGGSYDNILFVSVKLLLKP